MALTLFAGLFQPQTLEGWFTRLTQTYSTNVHGFRHLTSDLLTTLILQYLYATKHY